MTDTDQTVKEETPATPVVEAEVVTNTTEAEPVVAQEDAATTAAPVEEKKAE